MRGDKLQNIIDIIYRCGEGYNRILYDPLNYLGEIFNNNNISSTLQHVSLIKQVAVSNILFLFLI